MYGRLVEWLVSDQLKTNVCQSGHINLGVCKCLVWPLCHACNVFSAAMQITAVLISTSILELTAVVRCLVFDHAWTFSKAIRLCMKC